MRTRDSLREWRKWQAFKLDWYLAGANADSGGVASARRQLRPRPHVILSEPAPFGNKPAYQTHYREALRQYLNTWFEADRDFERWRREQPQLARLLDTVSRRSSYGYGVSESGDLVFVPLRARRLRDPEESAFWSASWDFFRILENPLRRKVKKCRRCARWFVKTTDRRNRVYCSGDCARPDTAARATKKRRSEEHKLKVGRVRRALWQFSAAKLHGVDWRAQVAESAGVTQKFLTRALNRGKQAKPGGLVLSKRLQRCIAKAESEARLLRTTRR